MHNKFCLLSAQISVHKFDIICLSETYLNSEKCHRMTIIWTYPVTILLETKHGGVCVYQKNTLPFKLIDTKYLHECISFEIRIGEKFCQFIYFYRSSSQTSDESQSFPKNVELALDEIHKEDPFLISILGDFNARTSNWCKNGTSHEGCTTDAVTSNSGLYQLIQEPTLILNSFPSYNELTFTSQPKLAMESGFHSSKLSSSDSLFKI